MAKGDKCKAYIIKHGLKPYIENGKWDGFTAIRPNGEITQLSDGLRRAMHRLGLADQPRRNL